MVQVSIFSGEWLSRYGPLENFIAEILHFGDVLDFTSSPTNGREPWGPMSWNKSLSCRVPVVRI